MNALLVADDLTGASDAGVQFSKSGLRTTVWLDAQAALDDVTSDVAVVDMNSRALPPDEAAAAMRRFVEALGTRCGRLVKKMDSTLRGNAGLELDVLLAAYPATFAIVAPAYPKNGRTVRDGVLLVDGTPVDRTDFGRDLFSPVRQPRVAAHFALPSLSLGLELVRGGTPGLIHAIEDARARGIRLAVADTETDDDLRALVALDGRVADLLWVGSAGLIEQVPHPAPALATAPARPPHLEGPVLFLVGSISAMTQQQIDEFAASAVGVVERLDPIAAVEHRLGEPVAGAARALACGHDVVLALDGRRERVEAALRWGAVRGLDERQTSEAILDGFTSAAAPLVDAVRDGAIVLSGGDVARAFCMRHGIRGLTLLAETAPGIPISRAVGNDLLIVTKAGGFGRPQTYRDILLSLHPQVTA